MVQKHSLVIGGTRGIGRAIVRALAGESDAVSVIGRREPPEEDRHIPGARHWAVDLLDRKGLAKVWKEIIGRGGPLNSLVFCQRYRGEGDRWTGEMSTSLTATKDAIEYLADEFGDTGENAIVVVSSTASQYIADEQPVSYHVAKAGLNQMVRYYAVTLGPKAIRVNGVSAGAVLKEESRGFYQQNPELHDLFRKISPLNRMGTSDDIANAVAFLCSPKASFITGQNIVVDGGLSLQGHHSLVRRLSPLSQLDITQRASQETE